ncbi:MAG: alpha/beta hydrolase [Anaerolineae bacterium]|nr:alpha/beta hydrolase [Anaerolineae bacterium]
MKRRLLIVLGLIVFALFILPFLIPLRSGGVDPATLAVDNGRFLDVNDLQTYVVERGPTDGQPLLFIHGLYGSTFTWRGQLDTLAEAGYRAIAYDRPGAGLSAKPLDNDYSPDAQADFAAALLDALGIDRAVIVGHSAGGNIAARFAVRHSDRIERLVLVDGAVVGLSGPPPFIGRLIGFSPVTRWGQIILPLALTRENLAGALRGFYADPGLVTPEVVDGYWRAFQTADWPNGLIGLSRDSSSPLAEETIRGITAPTLLIWGERDTVTPLAQGERLRDLLPDASLTIIPGVGHQPMEEAVEAFNAALLGFLSG